MQIVFSLAYSLVVALLFVLFVILGTQTLYAEPKAPAYPRPSPFGGEPAIFCDFRAGLCQQLKGPSGMPGEAPPSPLTLDEARRLYPEVVKAQENAEKTATDYQDARLDYFRNVFIVASVLGVVAISGALYLFRRVEAMPQGLLLGGLGVVIFGWIQAAEDFGEMDMAPLFAVVAAELVVVLAAGYRFLGSRPAAAGA